MKIGKWSILATCVVVGVFGLNLMGQDSLVPKKAPAVFQVKFETTAGNFVVEVHRDWAQNGSDRFYQLVKSGYYDDCKFFRVVPNFMVQFGINGDPKVTAQWDKATIKDDPVMKSNKRGFVTFAKLGLPNTRTTQVFINLKDNSRSLDPQGFASFGEVVKGMDIVEKINGEYGENPDDADVQGNIRRRGNEYLDSKFPKLDGIKKATILDETKKTNTAKTNSVKTSDAEKN